MLYLINLTINNLNDILCRISKFLSMYFSLYILWTLCFILSLYATGTDGMPIQIGTPPISSIGNGALYSLKAVKSSETDLMMKELGAMVEELQTMGDMAIEKWKR